MGVLTANVTGKGGNWREKLPVAESAPAPHALCGGWGQNPLKCGQRPHLSAVHGIKL